jgi:hypothetical protein
VESGELAIDGRQSTLRAVFTFSVIAISVIATLFCAGQALYWCLARLLGVTNPSAMGENAATALSGTTAMVIVFGMVWALFRHDLKQDEAESTAFRRDEVGWFYRYLITLIALGTFVFGGAMLLWNLIDELNAGDLIAPPLYFRDNISLGVTMLAVGFPVWLRCWRAQPNKDERLSLSRRLYLFAALLVSMLTGLSAAVWLATLLLNVLLGAGALSTLDVGHALSLVLVAVAVAFYHGQLLRQDNAYRSAINPAVLQPASEQVPSIEPMRIVVEITGASDSDVREALGALPMRSKYEILSIRSAE